MKAVVAAVAVTVLAAAAPGPAAADPVSLVELAAQGEDLWRRSCPITARHGSCITVRTVRAADRCSAGERREVVVKARRPALARKAAERFRAVLARWPARAAAADPAEREAAAAARFHLVEADFEAVLALRAPRGLDFPPDRADVTQKSSRRFARWLRDARAAVSAATAGYRAVAQHHQGTAYALAAMARTGQLLQHFADLLASIPVPPSLRRGSHAADATAAFCDTLAEQVAPLSAQAQEVFAACAGASDVAGSQVWRDLCRAAAPVAP